MKNGYELKKIIKKKKKKTRGGRRESLVEAVKRS
jgi:hypothetical protein